MDAKECYRLVEQSGWLAGWPEAACKSARKAITANKEIRAQHPDLPGAAMISVWGDGECIYDEGSYTTLVEEFASGSHGFFKPEDISEEWLDAGDGDHSIELSFRHGAKTYTGQMTYDGDYMDGAIVTLINQAMADCKPALSFVMPGLGFGQEFGFLLAPTAILDKLIGDGLFPAPEEMDVFEEEEEEESLTPILEQYESFIELEARSVGHVRGDLG